MTSKPEFTRGHGQNEATRVAQPPPKKALVPKPVAGKVDYAALRKKVMTRFRKTLAYLAK